jgi:hypothetical protein
MSKLSTSELKALLQAERSDALAAVQATRLSSDRTKAMQYYNGDVSQDMPAIPGRSSAVSTDVSDTIEGLMPQLMDIFCGSDEVVKFTPVGPEDQGAAEQETDYVNHVFMQKNSGFLILYSFIKDALLSKTGIVKCWWEDEERESRQTYYDLTDEQYMMIAAAPDAEIIEHTEKLQPGYGGDEDVADAEPDEGENART